MAETKVVNETEKLDPEKDYPFRASLKVARCGMCKRFEEEIDEDDEYHFGYSCSKGHELKGPLMVKEHDCEDYEYKPDLVEMPPDGKMIMFMGLTDKRPECDGCSHLFYGRCDGLKWWPIELKDGKCQFFRDEKLTCKHAIPKLQYGDHIRNNYCSLPPEKRFGCFSNNSWKCHCNHAHAPYAEHYKCYEPRTKNKESVN